MDWTRIKFFKRSEFDSPDAPGSGDKMDQAFVIKLDLLRMTVGFPLVINSGYRSPAHNAKVGGVTGSEHGNGHGADLKTHNTRERMAIVKAALDLGFRRIGVAETFVHVGDDPTKPQDVMWLY